MMKNLYINNHIVHCTDDCVTIINSFDIDNFEDILKFTSKLKIELENYEFIYVRSNLDWAKEWYTHNIFYKLGLFRSHTKSVDLSEYEQKYRLLCYNLIYIFYKCRINIKSKIIHKFNIKRRKL